MTKMGNSHTGRGAMRIAPLLAAAAVSLAVLGFAAPALAGKPTGPYVNFGECPQKVAGVNLCVYATSSSGEFAIKKTTVPITKLLRCRAASI